MAHILLEVVCPGHRLWVSKAKDKVRIKVEDHLEREEMWVYPKVTLTEDL